MTKAQLVLRGRLFSPDDLDVISRCVYEHFNKGRTFISRAVCEELDWRQPNGWLKDRPCRDVLRELDKMGIITLPPSLVNRKTTGKARPKRRNHLSQFNFVSAITVPLTRITLEIAKGNRLETIWNEVVDDYHYLGHKVAVGRCIKYLIKGDGQLLGALSFSSPAWRLAPRDSLLFEIGFQADEIGSRVIANNRFLILPNIHVHNLASRILSLATRQIVKDWTDYYSITPLVAETFVQGSLYRGTCYRAANWIEVGSTKGYAKKGASHHNSQKPKTLFLYGLNRHIRRRLLERAITANIDRGRA